LTLAAPEGSCTVAKPSDHSIRANHPAEMHLHAQNFAALKGNGFSRVAQAPNE
jgi:hypothetical protein